MSVKHYRIGEKFLGTFVDGAKPQGKDAVECYPPANASDLWDGSGWIASPSRDQVQTLRLRAYADPLTGSDRLKTEADAERASGDAEKADKAEAAWLSRRAEIAAQYPWPEGAVK